MTVNVTERSVVLSNNKVYRYQLGRIWNSKRPSMLYVMLNPSTANAVDDDPTIRSCVRLADHGGFGSIEVVNLFALRSTDPKMLKFHADPVGPECDGHIRRARDRCDVIVCAWGAYPHLRGRDAKVLDILTYNFRKVYCFGMTKSGAPRHPLYIKTGTTLVERPHVGRRS